MEVVNLILLRLLVVQALKVAAVMVHSGHKLLVQEQQPQVETQQQTEVAAEAVALLTHQQVQVVAVKVSLLLHTK